MESLKMADGTPFDQDKEYIVATKQFLASGKDGYTAFIDPSVKKLPANWGDDSQNLQTIFLQFAKNFGKSNWGIAGSSAKWMKCFKARLELFNASINDRDEETGCIKIAPKVDGRLVNIREKIDLKV